MDDEHIAHLRQADDKLILNCPIDDCDVPECTERVILRLEVAMDDAILLQAQKTVNLW